MATLEVGLDPNPAARGARVVKRSMDDIKRGARGVEQSTTRLGRSANDNFTRMSKSAGLVNVSLAKMTRLAAPLGAALAAAFSVRPIFAFQDAIAEVSTLVDTATFDMRGLEQAALDQARAFGGSTAQQAKGFYQVISAGASTAAEATEILTAANKLAVGGVTDVGTAADGLTSILNAYGDQVEGASAVSDALFIGMQSGKTTIGELSSSLGRVAPLAAQTGVSFDELTASISALTKGGIATAEATTGVRAILAAVAKPTSEATKLADQLGLEFNSAALEAQGLAGFLETLVQKTGGSTDALSQLFGGVEALVPAMALSGQAGTDFAAIMEQMGVKAGATQDAFDKMAASPGFQAGRIWSALEAEVVSLGGAMGDMLVPVMRAVADNLDTIAAIAKVAGVALATAFAPAALAAMATGLTTIGAAGVAAMRAITIAIASNPLGALAAAITTTISAIYFLRDEIEQAIGVDVYGIVGDTANSIIGFFVGAYRATQQAWSNLPTFFSAVGKMAYNSLVAEFEKPLLKIGDKTIIPGADMSAFKAELSGAETEALKLAEATVQAAEAEDYLRVHTDRTSGSVRSAEDALAEFNEQGLGAAGVGGVLGDVGDSASEAAKQISEAQKSMESFIGTADGLAEEMFPAEYARREAQELQALMEQFGGALDEFQRAGVNERIRDLYTAASLGLRDLEDETEKSGKEMADSLQSTLGSVLSSLFDGPMESLDEFVDKAMDAFAQLGQQNLSAFADNLFGRQAANDNTATPVDAASKAMGEAVRAGAESGSETGNLKGFSALFSGKSGAFIGAGLGGLGIGYSSQSPLMGAIGGAASGFASGAAIGGAAGPIGAVIGGIAGLVGGIMGMNKAVAEARAKIDEQRVAIEQLAAAARGEIVSDYAQQLAEMNTKLNEAIALADKANDRELQRELMLARDSLRGTLAEDFREELEASLYALTDQTFFNTAADALEQYQTRLKDAEELGTSSSGAFKELRLTLQAMANESELTQKQLDDLVTKFPELSKALGQVEARPAMSPVPGILDDAVQFARNQVAQARDQVREAYERESNAIEEVISKTDRFIESIRQFRDSIALNDTLTTLGPREQLDEAESQLMSAYERYLNGDKDAQDEIIDLSRQYAEEARGFYANSEQYARVWKQIQDILDNVENKATGQLSEAEKQLAELKEQTSVLELIEEGQITLAEAIENLGSATQQLSEAQKRYEEETGGYSDEVEALYRDVVGRAPDAEGAAYWQKELDTGISTDEAYKRFIHDVIGLGATPDPEAVAKYGVGDVGSQGVPHYATGTDFHPGGWARINEMGGENVYLPRGTQVIPHDVSMRMASNDNSGVERAIGALQSEVRQLGRIVREKSDEEQDVSRSGFEGMERQYKKSQVNNRLKQRAGT